MVDDGVGAVVVVVVVVVVGPVSFPLSFFLSFFLSIEHEGVRRMRVALGWRDRGISVKREAGCSV